MGEGPRTVPDGARSGRGSRGGRRHQATVLDRLDAQVHPRGAVAIFSDTSIWWNATSPWKTTVRSVIQDFLGIQRRAGSGVFTAHDRLFSDILRESPFSDVTETTVAAPRTHTADSIIGYLHSTSFAATHQFGDRLGEFHQAIRDRLADLSDTDTFTDDNEFHILIARRPRT